MKQNPHIAIYTRQSVDKDNSISIETQADYCKCAIRPDERDFAVKIYEDRGWSGGDTNRPQFQKMMQEIEKGRVKKVMVYKLDRISRSLCDFVGILDTIKRQGVEFVSTQEAFDTGSPYGELIVKILMVFAEFERQSIIRRVTDAYGARSDMGIYMGGRRPYGFSLQPAVIRGIKTKTLAAVPEEMEQVEWIYALYAREGMSLDKVVCSLVENRVTPFGTAGWSGAKIRAILKNPLYVRADAAVYDYFSSHGTIIKSEITEFDGTRGAKLYGSSKHDPKSDDWSDMKLVLMQHEGAVDSDVWIKCQKKLEKNGQIRRGAGKSASWLGGLLRCGACGHTMSVKSTGSGRYFLCSGRINKKICKGIQATVYAGPIEAMMEAAIAEKLDSLRTIKARTKQNIAPRQNDLQLKVMEIEREEAKLVDALLEGAANAPVIELVNRKALELKRKKDVLYAQMEELESQRSAGERAVNLVKWWARAHEEEKRAIARVLVERIDVLADGGLEVMWNV